MYIINIRFDYSVMIQAEEKKKMLRKYPFFKLEVIVGSGRDLIAMDRGGKFVLNLLLQKRKKQNPGKKLANAIFSKRLNISLKYFASAVQNMKAFSAF